MLTRRRGTLYLAGAVILAAPPAIWLIASYPHSALAPLPPTRPGYSDVRAALPVPLEAVRQDPMLLVRLGRERYLREIREYRCVLLKQERLAGGLTPVQEVEVRYRETPHTVYMLWRKNADQAKRALWMQDPRFVDKIGRKVALVEPAGAIARLFVSELFVPIDGPEARKLSRRTIDECGFRSTFELLERYNALAQERGVLKLWFDGFGEIDGRPTYVIRRDLPYEGPNGPYPDGRMVLHLDQEWLLPVAVFSYADQAEKELLGSYVFTKVELNPGFADDAFTF